MHLFFWYQDVATHTGYWEKEEASHDSLALETWKFGWYLEEHL